MPSGGSRLRRPRKRSRATSGLLRQGQVILLDAGTTTLEVARGLPPDLDATVITNSPPIAVALAEHPTVEVTMLGGRLEGRSGRRRRRDRGGAARRSGRRARPRRLQPPSRGRYHRDGSRGVVREAGDDRERRRGGGGVLGREARLGGPYVVAPLDELTHLVTERSVPADTLAQYRGSASRWCPPDALHRAAITLVFFADGLLIGSWGRGSRPFSGRQSSRAGSSGSRCSPCRSARSSRCRRPDGCPSGSAAGPSLAALLGEVLRSS